MNDTQIQALETYANIFGNLTEPDLPDLKALLHENVVFTDPFNWLTGPDSFIRVFEHMFDTMDEPKFDILDICWSQNAGYIKWHMTGRVKSARTMPINITGMSEISLDDQGLVLAHHDHWDSGGQLLIHIPYVGWIVRRIMKLFTLKA